MKRFLSMISVALVMLMLFSSACAELKRGSTGEDVVRLQEMLSEMGFLNDTADGAYGQNTEDAVKAFQAYCGMQQTGKADDRLLVMILNVYYTARGEMGGDGLSEEELMEMYPKACSFEGESEWGAVFCYRHIEESRVSELIWRAGLPEKLEIMLTKRGCELWMKAISDMFDEWEQSLPVDQQSVVANQRVAFKQNTDRLIGGGLSEDFQASLMEGYIYLEEYGIRLCSEIHRGEAQVASGDGE